MTLLEKAKEMFGEDYVKQCPSEVFNIACLVPNDNPACGSKSCWEFHQMNNIEYDSDPRSIVIHQIF